MAGSVGRTSKSKLSSRQLSTNADASDKSFLLNNPTRLLSGHIGSDWGIWAIAMTIISRL